MPPKIIPADRIAQLPRRLIRGGQETALTNAQLVVLRKDDDVKDTEAVRIKRARINELLALQQNEITNLEVKRLRQNISNQVSQQRRATNKRRDAVVSSQVALPNSVQSRLGMSLTPGSVFNFSQLEQTKQAFAEFEGKAITIQIVLSNGERETKHLIFNSRRFFQDIFDGFLGEKDGSSFTYRADLANGVNLKIVLDENLPANKTWRQVFAENETRTCVIDSLQSLLDITKKDDKTLNNKLTKLKKEFSNGMTEEQINEHIVQSMRVPIDIHTPFPIQSLVTSLSPVTDKKHFRKLKLTNNRPHHVIPQYTDFKIVEFNDFEKFKEYIQPKLQDVLYSTITTKTGDYMRYILPNEQVTYKKEQPSYIKEFKEQYAIHSSYTDKTGTNLESELLEHQALEWSACPLYIKNGTMIQELDLTGAYLQYKGTYAGYLIAYEDSTFSQECFSKITSIHDNDWTETYFDIQITQMTTLLHILGLPDRLIAPSWFIKLIFPHIEFVIFRYEVRKSFTLDLPNGLSKKEYVKLFGKTAQTSRPTVYTMNGEQSPEFCQWVKTKSDKATIHIRKSVFDDEIIYTIQDESSAVKTCPQILNTVSLFCFSELFKVAQTVPIDTIVGKTLDSLLLSTPITPPPNFTEKGELQQDGTIRHTEFTKETIFEKDFYYTHVKYPTPAYTNSELKLTQRFHHKNFALGSGGSGKTHQLMHQAPSAILALPTHELIDAKRIEYPNRIIMTHNALHGWNSQEKRYTTAGVILYDEITQRSNSELEEVSELNPKSTIFYMGDIDEQTGIPFQCFSETTKYTIHNPIYFTNDYRSIDEETKTYKLNLRKRLQKVFTHKLYEVYDQIDQIVDEFVTDYSEYDDTIPILTATRWNSDYYESIERKALNAHRVQGKTLSEVFQIDTTCMSHQAFYTCISRCRSISQLRFVKASNKDDARWNFRKTAIEKMK